METISNAAGAASKLIFGDNKDQAGTEPVSGQTGPGTADQPYDAGNTEAADTSKAGGYSSTDPTSTSSSDPTTTSEAPTVTGPTDSTTSHHSESAGASKVDPAENKPNDITGMDPESIQKPIGGPGTNEASVSASAAPGSGAQPVQKQQGADRALDEPEGEEVDAVKGKKDEAEAQLSKRDPNDHSGEPMHMHGSGVDEKTERSKSIGQEGGGEHGKEKGTGQEHVKTSGLAADGGDFDATKPGAGKEANRLLESKGIHKDSGESASPAKESASHTSGGSGEKTGEKKKTSEKIKEKLHIGKH